MKNKIIIIVIIFLIILSVSAYMVYNYRKSVISSQKVNESYKAYYDTEILGTELISIINKTVDFNEQNGIQKDENGMYIENDNNSIKIYISFKYEDDYQTVEMEKISNNGTDNFRKVYSTASFKCTEISYHDKTKTVKALTFTET